MLKIANNTLLEEVMNKNLAKKLEKKKKIIMNLNLKLISLKTISHDDGEVMTTIEEQRFLKTKGGRPKHIEMIVSRFAVII